MALYRFRLEGKFKPCVRMTQRSMHVDSQAQQYLADKVEMGRQLKAQMAENGWEMLAGQTPLVVDIRISRKAGFYNSDLDNMCKGILDAASGIVYPDDRWIDCILAMRERGERDMTWFQVQTIGEGEA